MSIWEAKTEDWKLNVIKTNVVRLIAAMNSLLCLKLLKKKIKVLSHLSSIKGGPSISWSGFP